MTTATTTSLPTGREPALIGQTVVVIGASGTCDIDGGPQFLA
jgi:hypothetical protein